MLATLAGLSILIIGDSHLANAGYLIDTLQDPLVQAGAKVHTIGVCGSVAGDWTTVKQSDCGGAERVGKGPITFVGSAAATKPVKQLIAADKPDLVVVVMGDTMGGYKQATYPKAWAYSQVSALTKDIASTGTSCVWVGPAWGSEGGQYGKTFDRVKQASEFLAANVAPCSYVDSLAFSKPGQWRTIDGQHFTSTGYKQWGSAIANAIAESPAVAKKK
ncbi:SGNH/GDSL hydrolase family protein [Xylophilus rhododendri]|uniref:SGNH/GDSL hydrolase family protein n=1 Tax=Xylophilus rhododendri TaxID=2697032 RepID=A0A857J6Q6_9BURK|nr:SGNH/GDSL hydrolase family protein [Xylophilus rhododendri]QHI98923.1 SGNH/GDSL hydrolase family protein [Xylophilus rhododendri]